MFGNSPAAALPLLTRERIEAVLKAHDWTYHIDSDGDVGGLWDNSIFFFSQLGQQKEILQVRGRWHQSQPIERRADIRALIDEWHDTKIWPKGYTKVDDQGKCWVFGEHSVDWEHGVADKQLDLTICSSLVTTLGMFEFLGERL
ncbi:MAG: YbjN domain-containing protein [Micrococcales bacterium]|nr:YbjN domain-containing protein [Micrococcales bacterium]